MTTLYTLIDMARPRVTWGTTPGGEPYAAVHFAEEGRLRFFVYNAEEAAEFMAVAVELRRGFSPAPVPEQYAAPVVAQVTDLPCSGCDCQDPPEEAQPYMYGGVPLDQAPPEPETRCARCGDSSALVSVVTLAPRSQGSHAGLEWYCADVSACYARSHAAVPS